MHLHRWPGKGQPELAGLGVVFVIDRLSDLDELGGTLTDKLKDPGILFFEGKGMRKNCTWKRFFGIALHISRLKFR